MRRVHLCLCLLGVVLLWPCVCPAQDASKIIDQYVKASGGAKNLAKIHTLFIDGTIQPSGQDTPGTYSLRVKLPNRYYTEFRVGGKTIIDAYNGKSAWEQTESGPIATLLGPQALELEAAAQYYNSRFLSLGKKKVGAAFKGKASMHGHETYQIELTYPTGIQWEVFFDQQSHLITAEKATLAGIPWEICYDDYQPTNGVKMPYQLEVHRGTQVYNISVTRAGTNETVGERVFDFPIHP
jgi:hypothetical protein